MSITQNWGNYAVGALTEDYAVTYVNRACSNGVTQDLYEWRHKDLDSKVSYALFFGDWDCSKHNFDDAYYTLGFWVNTVVGYTYTCNALVRPQLENVGTDVDIVLLTFGGNDAGFPDLVMECFVPERDACACSEKVAEAYRWMDENAEGVYMKLFRDLRARMRPGARVVMSSYPYLTLADNDEKLGVSASYRAEFQDECDDGSTQRLNAAREMRNMVETFAAKVGEYASRSNAIFGEEFIRFVDVTKKFDNHGLFAYGGWAHIPGPASLEPEYTIAGYENSVDCYLYDILSTGTIMEWWHPKEIGQVKWAQEIAPSLIDAAYEAVPRPGMQGRGNLRQSQVEKKDLYALDVAVILPAQKTDVVNDILEGFSVGLEALDNVTSNYRFGFLTSAGDIAQNLTSNSAALGSSLESLGRQELDSTALFVGDELKNVTRALNSLNWYESGVTSVAILIIDDDTDVNAISVEETTTFVNEARDRSLLVYVIDLGSGNGSAFGEGVASASSALYINSDNIISAIEQVVGDALTRPMPFLSEGYTGLTNERIIFDTEGTYDPLGASIEEYEWEFPGGYRITSQESKVDWSFSNNYEGTVYLKVTNENGKVGIAATNVKVGSDDSDIDEQETGDCPIDENGESVIFLNGTFQNCHATNFPFPRANGTDTKDPLSTSRCAGVLVKACKCKKKNGSCHAEEISSLCNVDLTDRRKYRKYKKAVNLKWKKRCEKRVVKEKKMQKETGVTDVESLLPVRKGNVLAHNVEDGT